MLSTPASPGSLRWVAIGLAVLLVALLIVFPCPPWSLKVVIAQRAQCVANLKQIAQDLRDRGIPLDERHSVRFTLSSMDGTWNAPRGPKSVDGLPITSSCSRRARVSSPRIVGIIRHACVSWQVRWTRSVLVSMQEERYFTTDEDGALLPINQ